MLSFSIYPENGVRCVLIGEDIKSVLSSNQKVLLHYLGEKSEIINYKITETGNNCLKKYRIVVEYLKYRNYADKIGETRNIILWVDEVPYVKMPWEK